MIQCILYVFTTFLATLLAAYYLMKKWNWTYWARRGVEAYEPKAFNEIGAQYFESYFYLKKKGIKLGGTYLFYHPHYVVTDLDLIKSILIENFDSFVNRGLFEYKGEKDSMNGHLFNLEDQEWRNLRNKLTPTFTSGKIKMMFQTLVDTTWNLENVLQECADAKVPFEMKDVMARFTTDVIGSVGFGIECNTLKTPDSDFRRFGRAVMENMDAKTAALFLFTCLPKLVQKVFQQMFKKQLRKSQSDQFDTQLFFRSIVQETVAYREKNNVHRNDFLHLLLLLKNKGTVEEAETSSIRTEKGSVGNLTLNEITAQCFLFFIAGFDTSSTAITFALYEISRYPEIQDKLREEIHQALATNDGKMTYDILMKLTYLDKVMNETLRMYPPVRVLTRKCKKDFPVPGSNHIIKKNEIVMIPAQAIHYDPEIYPDPETFNPERFSADKKAAMHTAQFMPFGEGPRMCIGSRFAQVQMKVGLACILNKFRVSLNSKTKLPLKREKSFLASGAVGGIWLDIEKY